MVAYAVPHLPGQVQSSPVLFQHFHNAHALLIVGESVLAYLIQYVFAGMAEGRVPQIMAQRNGLCQALIEPQGLGYGAGYLGYLQGMGEPGPVMVPLRRQKHLCLVLQPSKCLGVKDAVPVPLVLRPHIAQLLRLVPSPGPAAKGRIGAHVRFFQCFQ